MPTTPNDSLTSSNFYKRYKRYYTYLEPIIGDPLIRSYFTLVASLLLVTFFILFALSPTVNTILGLLKKIEDQKVVLSALDQKINNLIIAQENFAQVEPKLGLLDEALPTQAAPESIVQTVLSTNTANNIAMVSLEFGQIPLSTDAKLAADLHSEESPYVKLGLKEVKFVTGLSGPEDQVKAWVKRLENSPRLLKVAAFSFARNLKDDPLATGSALNVNIEGSGFYSDNDRRGGGQ